MVKIYLTPLRRSVIKENAELPSKCSGIFIQVDAKLDKVMKNSRGKNRDKRWT